MFILKGLVEQNIVVFINGCYYGQGVEAIAEECGYRLWKHLTFNSRRNKNKLETWVQTGKRSDLISVNVMKIMEETGNGKEEALERNLRRTGCNGTEKGT